MPRKATVRARGLGAELKELRTRTGLTTTVVGKRLGWSASTVSRIETGQRGVTSEEVAAMLVVYRATPEERERLVGLAREVDKPGWWETGDSGLPKQLTSLISFESQATRITAMSLAYVPGLLQTEQYAHAVMLASGVSASAAQTRVVTRMGRQGVLTRSDPVEFHAFIDEAVLRRPLGGAAVMAEQVRHLLAMGKRSNITIQVLPFSAGGHLGLDGSFVILEYGKAPTIVHLENKTSSLFLDDHEDTALYLADAATLENVALKASESARFLASIADTYEEQ
ncbi:helix-turn-helix domain-containing protein [Salinactinospora qingdaonensis]|uniref:Helix-turn-helix transcriptional regulator n=1 Tax=Salinactinospora qingdaonensis TaxID=702744 RepID=A0ABP7FHQ1_9ACTN